MNKLYVLTILFLAQPICAMEEQQATVVSPIYFNTSFACQLTQASFEDYMGRWVNAYGKARLDWTDEYVQSDQPKKINRQLAVLGCAQVCEGVLRSAKINVANQVSANCVEPILHKLAGNIPIARQLPIDARAVGMPLTCFLVGFSAECAELSLGHALFSLDVKRELYSRKLTRTQEICSSSLLVGARDLKVAAAVSLLKIAVDKGLQASGGYDRLESAERYLQERFPRFKKDSWFYRIGKNYARVQVYSVVGRMLHGHNRDYVKYLNQPDCGRPAAMMKDFLDRSKTPVTLHDCL